ncbi:MAG TPA: PSD1 and planctomycete cytochrome C domain-containing protein [Tepidisphaeraceae bacterium]|jgi:hypothetical protein|nr:PSD1 and planctomycete cytochrome C domain-containing protein [Tepidisphaeraceae bacterium]
MMSSATGKYSAALALLISIASAPALAAPPAIPKTIDFNRDIRPILSDNCYACHGPDKNKRKADLRLDTHDGIFSTIKDHHTVVPGKPDQSELYRRVIERDPDERMPDPKSNKKLSDREIALLKAWIEQDAPWQGHWAYLQPTRPAVPNVESPVFVKNPIDRFILARLNDAGLAPAPEAYRPTLIRRLSFDLIGLPPTPKETEQFVADASPDAYDKLVDRLLASPQYGERMAVAWLDLVRFADTVGYHSDNPMNVSPYRDYVIQSFNENKRFDQFTVEQLAGDLLPNPTTEQKVATAYNRLLQTTEEGGAQAKEYEVKNLTDRVRNVSTVWMGSTMGCCQCHDHKFDPFVSKDFYGMAAFFADVQEPAIGRREAGMPIPTGEQEQRIKAIDDAIVAAKAKLNVPISSLVDEQREWETEQGKIHVDWKTLELTAKTANGTTLEKQDDGSYLANGATPEKEIYTLTAKPDLRGITGFRIEALADEKLPGHGPGTSTDGNFILTSVKIESSLKNHRMKPIVLARATADFSQDAFPAASLLPPLKKGTPAPGWGVMPRIGKTHNVVLEPKEKINAEGETSLIFVLEFQSKFPRHQIGRVRLAITTSPEPAGIQSLPENVRDILATAPADRTEKQKTEIGEYFRTIAPSLKLARGELAKIEKEKDDLLATVRKCLVTNAGPPRIVRFLHRGNWMDTTGDEMMPAIPAFLAPAELKEESAKRRLTRMDLAKWIVSRDNPLTARVYVNRLWRLYFGTGLSKIMDDLGSQGEWPTHPELMDWMAVEFMDSGWDTKHMVKLLVTSGAYRQSSKPSDAATERDPYNRLLAHQSRWRIDAEFVRDDALAIGGLLVNRLGGPSVKPYQPAGYWVQLNFPTRTWVADKGDDEYRRGLYTWWQRSFLQPSLMAFDAPSREEAVCERNRSNIPQQALAMLNDPTYVEASRAFATRIMREGGASVGDRLNFAYEVAIARKPRPEEAKVLNDLLEKHLKEYAGDSAEATKLLSVGQLPAPKDISPAELAAWTNVARVILNLHETITRM